jgi:hypothetical protein
MHSRLVAFDDSSILQDEFYPLLLKNADTERTAEGAAVLMVLAIQLFSRECEPSWESRLYARIDELMDAFIGDGPDRNGVARNAIQLIKGALQRPTSGRDD